MSLTIDRAEKGYGYGQVSVVRAAWGETARIFAQLPCDEKITKLENGMFVKYDRQLGVTTSEDSLAEWVMVLNEERLFERDTVGHRETKKDFVYDAEDFFDGKIYPRCVGTTNNDTLIMNTVASDTYAVGDYLQPVVPSTEGWVGGAILTKMSAGVTATDKEVWKVVQEDLLPDGHKALRLQKIQ